MIDIETGLTQASVASLHTVIPAEAERINAMINSFTEDKTKPAEIAVMFLRRELELMDSAVASGNLVDMLNQYNRLRRIK